MSAMPTPKILRPGRRLLRTLCHLAVLGALVLPATPAGAALPPGEVTPDSHETWTKHSSDGRRGLVAPAQRSAIGFFAEQEITSDTSHRVARGVTFRRWRWTDERGPVRAQLLRVDLTARGVHLDHLSPGQVPRRDTVRNLVRKRGAVAGVNGDFFDISDTGAPLGNARGRTTALRSAAPRDGWTKSFWLTPRGVPQIGRPHLIARIGGRHRVPVAQWNAPTVLPGNVGAYLSSWGRTAGSNVVDGQRKRVREVVVRGGRVRSNKPRLRPGRRIRGGFVLVGRGEGADRLRRLRPGQRVRLTRRLSEPARVLISGSVILRKDGQDNTVDDREMHPRTAVGIDRDTGEVLLLVVDGRYEGSRGLTMKETSELMRQLGAEEALNLDGGGSSTMVARRPDGRLGVKNRPSDGQQRPVPNGLGVLVR